MVREFVASVLLLPAAGCSLILDFSDKAIPKDAQPDAPYTQAECDYKEPNDTLATAAPITPADTGPAAICAGGVDDHDFYKFTVSGATTKVEIRISTMYRSGGDLDLELYDATGTKLAESHNFSNDEILVCPAPSPACSMLKAGDYVFEVFASPPGNVNAYAIALTLTP